MSAETSAPPSAGTRGSSTGPVGAPSDDEDGEGDLDLALPAEPVLPPDGGWGWVIVIVGFLGCVIVDGIIFSFGIVFLDIVDYFNAGTSQTAWIGSVMAGMYLIIGPVVSALANRYSCRTVTIVGAIISSIGLMLSFFATSIDFLIFSYGILGGIGFGFIYLPCVVMVQFYFDKRRAFATGICVCGSGIGAFIFAPLSRVLISEYGWKGNILIQSAIVMNMVALGALLRPLQPSKKPPEPPREGSKPLLQRIKEQRDAAFHKSHSAASFRNYYGSDHANEDEALKESSSEQLKKLGNNNIGNGVLDADKELAGYRYLKPPAITVIPTPTIEEEDEDEEQKEQSSSGSRTPAQRPPPDEQEVPPAQASPTPHMATRTREDIPRRISMIVPKTQPSVQLKCEWERRKSLPVSINVEINRPFYRQDIFYSGSLLRIPQFSSQHSLSQYHCSIVSIPKPLPEDSGGSCFRRFVCPKVMRHTIGAMSDFSLLRSPTFLVLCVSSFLTMMGFFVPFVYLANYAAEVSISKADAAFLFSVIGIANTAGRVFSGWVSDRPNVDALLITNVALTTGGVATAAVPLLRSYELLIAYSAVFGLAIACFASLRSIILVELLGLEKLTNSFGLLMLFQGIASLIGSPIAGFCYDLTQTYNASFVIAGSLIALSGIMGFPLPYISRWEKLQNLAKSSKERGPTDA